MRTWIHGLYPFFLLFACTQKSENPKSIQSEIQVEVQVRASQVLSSERIETDYSFSQDACRVAWQTISVKKDQILEVQLINRTKCERSFLEVTKFHQKVLARVLEDYSPRTITGLMTGGLSTLQPDGSWNVVVAKAAELSKEYQDYRQKYPDHKSKKSVNTIFADLVRQTEAHLPFKQMLQTQGLHFELEGVEKVFNTKNEKGDTVIDDAGLFWWKPANSH